MHPSHEGLYHAFVATLVSDGIDESRAEVDARQACDAVWKLFGVINRSDIPNTVAYITGQDGVISRLLARSSA